jgi:hypothetical protein
MSRLCRKVPLAISLLLAMTGCIQPVEIEPPAERDVFVKCVLMNDTVQSVTLLYSGAIGAERFEPVEEAEVVIIGPGSSRYVFRAAGEGRWEHDFHPKDGGSYELHIQIPGRQPITATTTFPKSFVIASKAFAPVRWYQDVLDHGVGVRFHSLVPESLSKIRRSIPNYEEIVPPKAIIHEGGPDPDLLSRIAEAGGTTAQQVMPGMAFLVVSEEDVVFYVLGMMTDEQGKRVWMDKLGTNHSGLDLANLAEEPFHFFDKGIKDKELDIPEEFAFYDPQQDVFAQSPENRDIYVQSILASYEGQPLCDDYLRIVAKKDYSNGYTLYSLIDDKYKVNSVDSFHFVSPPFRSPFEQYDIGYYLEFEALGTQFFSIYGDFSYNVWGKNASEEHPVLYFCVPSAEYDLYLQQIRKFLNEKGDMLSSLYIEMSNNYSNIRGATGVFGALSVLRYDCDCSGSPFDHDHEFYYQRRLNLMTPAPLPEL